MISSTEFKTLELAPPDILDTCDVSFGVKFIAQNKTLFFFKGQQL